MPRSCSTQPASFLCQVGSETWSAGKSGSDPCCARLARSVGRCSHLTHRPLLNDADVPDGYPQQAASRKFSLNRCTVRSAKAPDHACAAQSDVATAEKAVESNVDVGTEGDGSQQQQQQQQQQRRLPLFDAKVSAEADRHAKPSRVAVRAHA